MSKLKELLESIEPTIKGAFDKFGEIQKPTWFCEDENNERGIIFTDISSPDDKNALHHMMKAELKNRNIVRYIAVMEMWFITAHINDDISNVVPSQRDDRQEGVLFSGEDRDTGEKIFKVLKINRSSGKPLLEAKSEIMEFDISGGRFTDLFDKHTIN